MNTLVSLKEHIDLFRKLAIPYKKQLVTMVIDIMKQHYAEAQDQLVDTSNNERMTIKDFIDAIMTPEPKEAKNNAPKTKG